MKSESQTEACRTRDRAATTAKLLEAGLAVFAKCGYSGATTKAIAKRAKVNESLITRYFESKEGLLIAIIAEFVCRLEAEGAGYPPQATLTAELEAYVRTRFERMLNHVDFFRITVSQSLSDQKFLSRVREQIPFHPDEELRRRLCALKGAGTCEAIDFAHFQKTIEAQIFGTMIFSHIMLGESRTACLESLRESVTYWVRALND